jgi:hypothetical protein
LVELRPIESTIVLPAGSDWGLIECARGKVAAKGSLARAGSSFGPALFDDLEAAVDAIKTWAQHNGVAVIYLKEAA